MVAIHGEEQLAIAPRVVDLAARRPVLVVASIGAGIRGELSRVLVVPLVGDHLRGGVGRVLQRVVLLVDLAVGDVLNLLANADQRVAEAVQHLLVLRLRRLDHQRAVHGEGHGGRVEAVVHHTLGDLVLGDAVLLEGLHVQDKLVTAHALLAAEHDRVVLAQARSHVVGVQDGAGRHLAQAVNAQHAQVHPRDGEQVGGAVRRAGHHGARAAVDGQRGVRGQERHEVLGHTDGTDAWAAAAVGHGEGLVEVEVAHISTDHTGAGMTHLRVHVGAVHVDLRAGSVDLLDNVLDALVEDTVGRWVGDHDARQRVLVLVDLLGQVRQVDGAVGKVVHLHHCHAVHGGRGGVRAVRRARDQADLTLALADAVEVLANGQQAGELAVRAGERLEAHLLEAGDGGEHLIEVVDDLQVALGVLAGRVGVHVGELGPGDGDHRGGAVQLHGAGAQRDHRVIQRQVLRLQLVQVAGHLVLAVVRVEDALRQYVARALERGGHLTAGALVQVLGIGLDAEAAQQVHQVIGRGGLVEGGGHGLVAHLAQQNALLVGLLQELVGVGHVHGDRVEVVGVLHVEAVLLQRQLEGVGHLVHARGDLLQTLRAVVHGVHAGHVRRQHLRRAHVRRGALSLDVLFTGLQRQAQALVAVVVDGHADDTARHLAQVLVLHRHVAGCWAAEAHGQTEALAGAHAHIGVDVAGGLDDGQGQQIGVGDEETARGVDGVADALVVEELTVGVGVLHQHARVLLVREVGSAHVAHDHLVAQEVRALAHDGDGGRVAVLAHEELLSLARLVGDVVGLGGGGGLVQQGGVGDGQAGEVADHGLEVQQTLQTALGDFSLVGRVAGVPAGVLVHVAENHSGHVRAVETLTDEALLELVLLGDGADLVESLLLRKGSGKLHLLPITLPSSVYMRDDLLGDSLVDQVIKARASDGLEHLSNIAVSGADVSVDKLQMSLEGTILPGNRAQRDGRPKGSG